MNPSICDRCQQPLPTSDPYRTVPFREIGQDAPLPRFRPWIKKVMAMLKTPIANVDAFLLGWLAPVCGIVVALCGVFYFGCWVRGCTVGEMRAAKALDPIGVSAVALYHEYRANPTLADAKYLGKPIVITSRLEEDFRVGNQGELLAPLRSGLLVERHFTWIVYDPRYVSEIDNAGSFGNAPSSENVRLKEFHIPLTFICRGGGTTDTISNPHEATPLLVDCRLANGAEKHYARQP